MLSKGALNLVRSRWRMLLGRPWLIADIALGYFLERLFCRSRNVKSFGWPQAFLYSWRIDLWRRYACVAQQIRSVGAENISILDVGGGRGTIKEFLNPDRYHLQVLDIKTETLRRVGDARLRVVAGDGTRLPFKDNSLDVVVSLDSLEHVPDVKKDGYCREIKRVAKRCVIIHCPADSSDGKFQGTAYDAKFLQWHRLRLNRNEPSTVEHLTCGVPKVEKLMSYFPGAICLGKQNVEVWLTYMKWCHIPYIRFIAGLLYKLLWVKKDDQPPYHACLLVWHKRQL